MLLGGKGGCQQCTCVPCNDCAQTCHDPHTGTAFGTVYHYYVLGVEEGNTSDGYLTASGDVDTSDPYDGMDGTGPWFQQISGGFTFTTGQTRYPCIVRISFWRNNFPLGATTIPPPSSALTSDTVTITCNSGKVVVEGTTLSAGESLTTNVTVPVVTGAGDQSSADPRQYEGTVGVVPVCDDASFTVVARIEWNVKKRQHILYGLVRECYEEGSPCATFCDGDPAPNVLYLTISNYTGPTPSSGSVEGTYVLERVSGYCDWYLGAWEWGCNPPSAASYSSGYGDVSANLGSGGPVITAGSWQVLSGECRLLQLWANTPYNPTTLISQCNPGVFGYGTNGVVLLPVTIPPTTSDIVSGSFDWEIST